MLRLFWKHWHALHIIWTINQINGGYQNERLSCYKLRMWMWGQQRLFQHYLDSFAAVLLRKWQRLLWRRRMRQRMWQWMWQHLDHLTASVLLRKRPWLRLLLNRQTIHVSNNRKHAPRTFYCQEQKRQGFLPFLLSSSSHLIFTLIFPLVHSLRLILSPCITFPLQTCFIQLIHTVPIYDQSSHGLPPHKKNSPYIICIF